METITVRLANIEDKEFIIESQVKMAFETERMKLDKDTVTRGVTAVFEDSLKGFYIIGQSEDGPCSCLMITPEWSDWRDNWVWWIQSVFVLPEFRKQGVFGMMYTFVQALVNQHEDVAGIRLYVDNTNMPARAVYSKIGMTDEHYRLFEWMKTH